jgi:hypothetical protein
MISIPLACLAALVAFGGGVVTVLVLTYGQFWRSGPKGGK